MEVEIYENQTAQRGVVYDLAITQRETSAAAAVGEKGMKRLYGRE